MTDDTQQYRNCTEDELRAVTTGGLTVHEWILIGQALSAHMNEPVDFDLTEMIESGNFADVAEAVSYADAYVERRNAQANRIMDAYAHAILSVAPQDSHEWQYISETVANPEPWYRASKKEFIDMTAQSTAHLN